MTTLNAIIFDLDGVLVDTIRMHNQAWRNVAQAGGKTLTATDLESLRGVRRMEGIDYLFPEIDLTPERLQQFIDIKHTSFLDALQHSTPDDILIDNAVNLIDSAQDMGLKLGIASSSVNAPRVIKRAGLTEKFEIIANGLAVSRSKPAPDIFVWVAGALGVSPQNVLVFEDSVAGIQGAKQAGMTTVGVVNPDTKLHADIYYQTLSDIQLDCLCDNLNLTIDNSLSNQHA